MLPNLHSQGLWVIHRLLCICSKTGKIYISLRNNLISKVALLATPPIWKFRSGYGCWTADSKMWTRMHRPSQFLLFVSLQGLLLLLSSLKSYPSFVLLNTPQAMLPTYTQDFRTIGLGLKDICIHYFLSCISIWWTELEFFMLSNSGKRQKSTIINQKQYLPSAQWFPIRNSCGLHPPLFRFLCRGSQFTGHLSYFCHWHKWLTEDFRFTLVWKENEVSFPCNEILCINKLAQCWDICIFKFPMYKSSSFCLCE